jgi:hypothetical protein
MSRPAGELGRNDALPGPGVDGTASTKCNHGGVGNSERLPLLLHDRDTKFCASFRELIGKAAVRCRERLSGLLKYYLLKARPEHPRVVSEAFPTSVKSVLK